MSIFRRAACNLTSQQRLERGTVPPRDLMVQEEQMALGAGQHWKLVKHFPHGPCLSYVTNKKCLPHASTGKERSSGHDGLFQLTPGKDQRHVLTVSDILVHLFSTIFQQPVAARWRALQSSRFSRPTWSCEIRSQEWWLWQNFWPCPVRTSGVARAWQGNVGIIRAASASARWLPRRRLCTVSTDSLGF